LSGKIRERFQAAITQSISALTRDTTALARPPPRYVTQTGGGRTRFSHERSIRRQTCAQATSLRQNSPFAVRRFLMTKASERLETKTPPERQAREGFETRTF
jgi:hypothetical protein